MQTILLMLLMMSPEGQHPANPGEVARAYGAGPAASYAQRLAALQSAYADHVAGTRPEAAVAMFVIVNEAAPADRVRLLADLAVIAHDPVIRLQSLSGVSKGLAEGAVPEPVRAAVAVSVWNAILQPDGNEDSAREGTRALLLAGDEAALDVVLTDAQFVRRLQRQDHWNAASDAGRFEELQAEYATRTDVDGAERAAIYRMAWSRKERGADAIAPRNPRLDLHAPRRAER